MKQLKFTKELVDLIKDGEKTSTWILYDESDVKVNDEILFVRRPEIVPFAKAKVIKVEEKEFKELSEKDKEGHDKYMTNHGRYKTYGSYEGKPVHAETPVKLIKFEVTEWL